MRTTGERRGLFPIRFRFGSNLMILSQNFPPLSHISFCFLRLYKSFFNHAYYVYLPPLPPCLGLSLLEQQCRFRYCCFYHRQYVEGRTSCRYPLTDCRRPQGSQPQRVLQCRPTRQDSKHFTKCHGHPHSSDERIVAEARRTLCLHLWFWCRFFSPRKAIASWHIWNVTIGNNNNNNNNNNNDELLQSMTRRKKRRRPRPLSVVVVVVKLLAQ